MTIFDAILDDLAQETGKDISKCRVPILDQLYDHAAKFDRYPIHITIRGTIFRILPIVRKVFDINSPDSTDKIRETIRHIIQQYDLYHDFMITIFKENWPYDLDCLETIKISYEIDNLKDGYLFVFRYDPVLATVTCEQKEVIQSTSIGLQIETRDSRSFCINNDIEKAREYFRKWFKKHGGTVALDRSVWNAHT